MVQVSRKDSYMVQGYVSVQQWNKKRGTIMQVWHHQAIFESSILVMVTNVKVTPQSKLAWGTSRNCVIRLIDVRNH